MKRQQPIVVNAVGKIFHNSYVDEGIQCAMSFVVRVGCAGFGCFSFRNGGRGGKRSVVLVLVCCLWRWNMMCGVCWQLTHQDTRRRKVEFFCWFFSRQQTNIIVFCWQKSNCWFNCMWWIFPKLLFSLKKNFYIIHWEMLRYSITWE